MALAERQAKAALDEPVDIVVTTAAGYPLDLTFYQGVKGMVAALPIVKPGGSIIIAQENAEGIGGPEFAELMLGRRHRTGSWGRLLRRFVRIDQWQLQEIEKVCRRATVLNVRLAGGGAGAAICDAGGDGGGGGGAGAGGAWAGGGIAVMPEGRMCWRGWGGGGSVRR